MSTAESAIARHPVFSGLPPDQIAFLTTSSTTRQLQKGEFLTLQGDLWPYLFLVLRGQVHAHKMSLEGRNFIVTSLQTGDLFWGLAFFQEDTPMPVTLEAVKPAQVRLWARPDLLPFLLQNGQVAWNLSCLMVQRMSQASEIIHTLAFQPVAGRLARFLVDLSPEQNSPVARSLTLDEMAARVGSTREVVCRFLQRFANDGLIDITRTEFTINDLEGLKEVAQQGKG
ncbi:MAG: Crp/Fnr family transcriptional regulator [Anaerolineales bacterium]|jgi:CRP-like cAMP-binding protein|nr:Crp/Fnr family transcriptional regulator [Anaerolineales bacterium]